MKIAIIGGGAAGLMSAATILKTNPEAEIFLIERNNALGKKVLISGGGRCNVTTGLEDIKTVLTKYPRGGKFLTSAMYNFPPKSTFEWFEKHGVPLKIQTDQRVFPKSDKSCDIVNVFTKLFKNPKIHLLLNTSVTQLEKTGDKFYVFSKNQTTPIMVEKVILTTGGQAYRQTGSTGDGYAFATSLGHTITELAPSLNSLITRETWPQKISGLSFPQTTIAVQKNKKLKTNGPLLFTHKGLSGPVVFAFSSLIAFEKFDIENPLKIYLDLFPEKTLAELLTIILPKNLAGKNIVNALAPLTTKSFINVVLEELNISQQKKFQEVSLNDLKKIINWLKAVPLNIIQKNAGEEFVTAGGVELSEVNPQTMESKLCPGLFFAGEILNIDAFTGGFNLQSSWATGYLAGENAAKI